MRLQQSVDAAQSPRIPHVKWPPSSPALRKSNACLLLAQVSIASMAVRHQTIQT
jgi:hypothetical protein